jgi:adenylate cyclase
VTDRTPRSLSLTFKVDAILIGALAVGIGAVIVAFAVALVGFRTQLSTESLQRQGDDHFIAVETLMVSGNAAEAVGYFTKVNLTNAATTITLYRRNGVKAFSDNSTIQSVNERLKKQQFQLKNRPATAPAATPTARFTETAGIPPQELFFRDDEGLALAGGTAYFRAYRPLINLPKCTVCHGADHTVRGIIDIRSNVTGVVRAQALTIGGAAAGFILVVALLALVIGGFLRRVVLRPVQAIGKVCGEVTSGSFAGRVPVAGNDEIGRLATTVNTMVEGLRERFELTKYVSSSTLDALKAGQEPRRVLRTLLFTDVRGFTSYTEKHKPEQVVAILNSLLEAQARIIASGGGDIDKFVGDEIVAVFSGDDAAAKACSTALALVAECTARADEFDGLSVGAGIASGSVIHGMIGSSRRADFTVIGDSVNVASRLCGIAKAAQVVVSDAIKTAVEVDCRFTGPSAVKLKGKKAAQRVWLLAGPSTGGLE